MHKHAQLFCCLDVMYFVVVMLYNVSAEKDMQVSFKL